MAEERRTALPPYRPIIPPMRSLRALAAVTAGFAYVLVALSPIVRITGSGMGCGDDWPLCNGRLIPPLDHPEVMIEWGHRLAAAGVSVLVIVLLGTVWLRRRVPGVRGPGGLLGPAVLAAILLTVQVLLGAVTVWLELPAGVVVLHLGNAMALLAVLVVAVLRAGAVLGKRPAPTASRTWRGALVAAGLGATALLLGGLTANLHAGPACQGFPLCNGQLWPASGGSALIPVHWAHRLVAYALLLHLIGVALAARRRADPSPIVRLAFLNLTLMVFHVVIAALMILRFLPLELRAAHAALGTLLWVGLVWLVWASAPVRSAATA